MIDIRMDPVYGATIGRVGENEHVRVIIPISELTEMYPEAYFGLLYKAPGSDKGYPIADFIYDDDYIYWTITSTEVTAAGTGSCEVTAYSGDTIAKSVTYKIKVLSALSDGGEPPEAIENWERVLNEIKAGAEEAADKIYAMSAEAETLDDGTEATASYSEGVLHFGIPKGDKGDPGVVFTPSVSEDGVISWNNNGDLPNPANVNIKGKKGDKGDPGKDAISPVITVSDILNGHKITLTDTTGTKSIDVMDGDTGNGISNVNLNDNYTLTITYTDGSAYTTPSIRGEKGDQGDPGLGLPAGGTLGQILTKLSANDYDTTWMTLDSLKSHVIYGIHIDSDESDPYEAVSYLGDAVGMSPAYMDFKTNTFIWGSWRNTFIMPRPCMLKYDGTVDYYLDENDYSKKESGEPSDISNVNYAGNAMMEWGRDGGRIWYKIVPEGDTSSATIYISDYKADNDYVGWSFMNASGEYADHFYTPIYNGSLDSSNRLRSISGISADNVLKYSTGRNEIQYAERNNTSTKKQWYTETYCDWVLINILLMLVGKSLDGQSVFGNGKVNSSSATDIIATGTMNDKGMFWGSNGTDNGVKIFGMENYWGNTWRRTAGLTAYNHTLRYKMTRGTKDGSQATDYDLNGSGYLTGRGVGNSDGYISKMSYNPNGFMPTTVGGSSSTYYADSLYQGNSYGYAFFGGTAGMASGPFALSVAYPQDRTFWNVSACVSCKP